MAEEVSDRHIVLQNLVVDAERKRDSHSPACPSSPSPLLDQDIHSSRRDSLSERADIRGRWSRLWVGHDFPRRHTHNWHDNRPVGRSTSHRVIGPAHRRCALIRRLLDGERLADCEGLLSMVFGGCTSVSEPRTRLGTNLAELPRGRLPLTEELHKGQNCDCGSDTEYGSG